VSSQKRIEQVYLHENASQNLNSDLAAGLEKVERFTNFGQNSHMNTYHELFETKNRGYRHQQGKERKGTPLPHCHSG